VSLDEAPGLDGAEEMRSLDLGPRDQPEPAPSGGPAPSLGAPEPEDPGGLDAEKPPLELEPVAPRAAEEKPRDPTGDMLLGALDDEVPLEPPRAWTKRSPYLFLPEAYGVEGERRQTVRFPLALPATLTPREGRPEAVRLTSGSVDAVFVQTRDPPEPDTSLEVEIEMLGSQRRRLSGRVLRTTRVGFVLQLEPSPSSLGFRAAFIELARQPSLQSPRIQMTARAPAATPPVEVERDALADAWAQVAERPDEDAVHQDFIHACMRARDLDFALERYREQLAAGDERAHQYLEQVGTIISFYNMQPKEAAPLEANAFDRARVRGLVALGLAVLVALGVGRALLGDGPPEDEPPAPAPAATSGWTPARRSFGE
jgi:hypothetical protein